MEWMLMPFRRYAEFNGRSRRMEYWMFALLNAIVAGVLIALMMAGGFSFPTMGEDGAVVPQAPGPLFWVGAGLLLVWFLATIVPVIAVGVRRLHDRDMSGWWYLGFIVLSMIPVVGFIASLAMIVIFLLPGTPGPNRYGPDPKSGEGTPATV
jgi:uncharacterized membrane protein YhaH (DUF805 family)